MLSWFEKNSKASWLLTFLIAFAIFYISSLTFSQSIGGVSSNLKSILYHFFAFFFLALFLLISSVKGKNFKIIIPAFFIALLYSILDEFHQSFVPGRYASIGDVYTNTLGIVLALLIYSITLAYRKNQ